MEEVTGLLSSRLKHVPYSKRNERSLEPEEQKGSVFEVVLEMLESTGYKFVHGVLDAAEYGAPQSRRRLIIIGLREGVPSLPNATHSRQQPTLFNQEPKTQTTFWEATSDLNGKDIQANGFSDRRYKYMELVPPGGYWRHLPEEIAVEAMGGAYNSGGGRMGYMRRLPWDDVSPTVVTSPNQKSTMLCHPEANRPISVEEYRRIQGFPDDWDLPGSTSTKYKLIGNAVPVHLSNAIAKHVLNYLEN
jgi:DNA (cytosine-5)-methyltransferase 1